MRRAFARPLDAFIVDGAGAQTMPLAPVEPPPIAAPRAQVFCDGACAGNGRRGARGGYGVLVTLRGADVHTVSEALPPGVPHTNQRAELAALLAAVKLLEPGSPVAIALSNLGADGADVHTDSEYALKTATVWGPGWRRRGWRTAAGTPVANLDLVEPLVTAAATVAANVRFHHVRGHQTGDSLAATGNRRADALAVAGAAVAQ